MTVMSSSPATGSTVLRSSRPWTLPWWCMPARRSSSTRPATSNSFFTRRPKRGFQMLRKLSELDGAAFDGIKRPYVPPKTVPIGGGLKLHRQWDTNIDPVTYEVIRHNLWNINEEHGSTIQRISGSPVAVYPIVHIPSTLTDDAEFVY